MCIDRVLGSNRSVRGGTGFRVVKNWRPAAVLCLSPARNGHRLTIGTREERNEIGALVATCTLRKFPPLPDDTKSGTHRDRHFANRDHVLRQYSWHENEIFPGEAIRFAVSFDLRVILYNSVTKSDACRFFVKSKEERMFML